MSILSCTEVRAVFVMTPKSISPSKTNIDALIGQEAIIIQTIEPRSVGRVKIKGEEWPAIADHHTILQKGTTVHIIRITGNKLFVK